MLSQLRVLSDLCQAIEILPQVHHLSFNVPAQYSHLRENKLLKSKST